MGGQDLLSAQMPRSLRRAAIAGGLALVLVAGVAGSAGAHSFDQPDRVLVSTTGNNSELVPTVNIGTAPGQGTVVMSLAPSGQPLQSGDGLKPSSELQVTTDCSAPLDKCVGTPYSYDPIVATRLILTSSADPTGSGGTAVVLAEQAGRTCTHEQHHCVIVFPLPDSPDSPFAVSPLAPPCTVAPGGCMLKLVLDAYNSGGQSGDVLIVGEDEPGCCGITKQDKGRVNAVRLRPVVAGSEPVGEVKTYSSAPRVSSVPVRDTVSEGKTVVFSQRLDKLRKNEQLSVSANMTTDISKLLRYNRALIQSRLILADSRQATAPSTEVKQVEELKGEISEANGFNCTQDTTPCETRKVGTTHLIQNAGGPLYVNLVVSSTPARSTQARPGEAVTVTGGTLKVVRYPASRYG